MGFMEKPSFVHEFLHFMVLIAHVDYVYHVRRCCGSWVDDLRVGGEEFLGLERSSSKQKFCSG